MALLALTFVAQPAAAEPVSDANIDIEKITVNEGDEDERTTVTVEYDTSLSVRVSTFLFGSEPLEERVLNSIGADEDEAEFVRLGPESAELTYEGETEDIMSAVRETPLVFR